MDATLTELSPNDTKFLAKKDQAERLAEILEKGGYSGEKFRRCGTFLEFKLLPEEGLKLTNANFCKSSLCPICSWRRAARWRQRLKKAIKDKDKWLFLTLTLKNQPTNQVGKTLDRLNNGWQELNNYLRPFTTSYIKVIEVSKAIPTEESTQTCHPHIHALININQNYFTDFYLNHQQWREIWKKSTKLEYLPIVNIQAINTSPRIISEIAKYCTKPADYLATYKRNKRGEVMGMNWIGENINQQKADFFSELSGQLHHRRLISTGGTIKKLLSNENDDDLIGGNDGRKGNPIQFIWRKPPGSEWPNYYAN